MTGVLQNYWTFKCCFDIRDFQEYFQQSSLVLRYPQLSTENRHARDHLIGSRFDLSVVLTFTDKLFFVRRLIKRLK